MAAPAPAIAADCGAAIAGRDHVLTGMLGRDGDAARAVNLFPLFASGAHLAYIACPVVERGGDGITDCRAGVLAAVGDMLRPAAAMPLAGCAADAGWRPECPDFTAEGFTESNGARLAAALKQTGAAICAHFGEETVEPLEPAAPRGEIVFTLHPDCAALAPAAARACAAAKTASPDPLAGVTAMRAGARTLVCAVSATGDLAACAE